MVNGCGILAMCVTAFTLSHWQPDSLVAFNLKDISTLVTVGNFLWDISESHVPTNLWQYIVWPVRYVVWHHYWLGFWLLSLKNYCRKDYYIKKDNYCENTSFCSFMVACIFLILSNIYGKQVENSGGEWDAGMKKCLKTWVLVHWMFLYEKTVPEVQVAMFLFFHVHVFIVTINNVQQ